MGSYSVRSLSPPPLGWAIAALEPLISGVWTRRLVVACGTIMLVYAAAFMLDLAAGTDESKITSPLWPPSPTRASPKPLESDASSLGHAAVLAALTVPLLLCGCQGVGAHECLESNLSFEAA
eukprot:3372884-Prymnesium_polylepis.1